MSTTQDTRAEKLAGSKPGPAKGSGGRPPLPGGRKKRRVSVYIEADLARWVEESGGSQFVARLVQRERDGQ